MVEAETAEAVHCLERNGWCLISLGDEEVAVVGKAALHCLQFFRRDIACKSPFRYAWQANTASDSSLRQVGAPYAGVGYLQGSTREWFHLAVDALPGVLWPSQPMRDSVMHTLTLLQSAATRLLPTAVLAAISKQNRQTGDMSVIDLFFYPNNNDPDDHVNMSSHTDPGLLTVTPCSDVPGLQLYDNHINTWIDVESMSTAAGSLLVFTGDGIEQLTKGRWRAATHRVRAAEKARLSIVYEMRLHNYDCSALEGAETSKSKPVAYGDAVDISQQLKRRRLST